jgi:hypothetical protein
MDLYFRLIQFKALAKGLKICFLFVFLPPTGNFHMLLIVAWLSYKLGNTFN